MHPEITGWYDWQLSHSDECSESQSPHYQPMQRVKPRVMSLSESAPVQWQEPKNQKAPRWYDWMVSQNFLIGSFYWTVHVISQLPVWKEWVFLLADDTQAKQLQSGFFFFLGGGKQTKLILHQKTSHRSQLHWCFHTIWTTEAAMMLERWNINF